MVITNINMCIGTKMSTLSRLRNLGEKAKQKQRIFQKKKKRVSPLNPLTCLSPVLRHEADNFSLHCYDKHLILNKHKTDVKKRAI